MSYAMKYTKGGFPFKKELEAGTDRITPHSSSLKSKDVDMEKLRSKQARSRKGISEFEYFADPNTQGDEPGVEGTYGGGTQTTDFSGKKKGKGKTQEERAKSLKNKK